MPNQNTQSLRDRMLAIMAEVNSQVAEREELVEAMPNPSCPERTS